MFSVSIYTLGCKLNQLESESLADAFARAGFSLSVRDETANAVFSRSDIVIINTCTVTSRSDQKARRVIRKALRDNPEAAVIVTGCYAKLDKEKIETLEADAARKRRLFVTGDKAALLALPAYLARAAAPAEADALAEHIARWFAAQKTETPAESAAPADFAPKQFSFHTRAFLKIQDGCDNHCTYCRIRLARGKSESVPAREILARLQALENSGYREAVLTGVNITQYRENADQAGGLARLLAFLLDSTRTIGIRLSSLEPLGITGDLAEVLAHPRIRPHFHLSVQSGSRSVLEKMGRAYSGADVEKAAALLRQAKENPFLACDIIAGFPGEGETEFAETLSLCEKIRFAWIHAFPYSKRPGTPAFFWRGAAGETEAARRVAVLTRLAEQNRREYARQWTGRELAILVESGGDPAEGCCRGLTGNYLRTLIFYGGSPRPAAGTVVNGVVRASERSEYDVEAEI